MKTFAEIENNIVVNIVVADDDVLFQENPLSFVEYDVENIAYINGQYINGIFIMPQPFVSWSLDVNNDWQPPTLKPEGNFMWDESSLSWIAFPVLSS